MQRLAWTLGTGGVALLGWALTALALPVPAEPGEAGPLGRPLTAAAKEHLRGADTGGGGGEKRCLIPGTKFGCPGRSCSGGIGSICVLCTNEVAIFNDECSTLGTGPVCTVVTVHACDELNPPILGSKGTCTSAGCVPLNPAVLVACGVYATCP